MLPEAHCISIREPQTIKMEIGGSLSALSQDAEREREQTTPGTRGAAASYCPLLDIYGGCHSFPQQGTPMATDKHNDDNVV